MENIFQKNFKLGFFSDQWLVFLSLYTRSILFDLFLYNSEISSYFRRHLISTQFCKWINFYSNLQISIYFMWWKNIFLLFFRSERGTLMPLRQLFLILNSTMKHFKTIRYDLCSRIFSYFKHVFDIFLQRIFKDSLRRLFLKLLRSFLNW